MLCSALIPRPLLPGHDLCHPGDKADCLWILQKGAYAPLRLNINTAKACRLDLR